MGSDGLLTFLYNKLEDFAEKVLNAWLVDPIGKRALTMTAKTKQAGLLFLKGKDKLFAIYLARQANSSNEASDAVIVGSMSNNPARSSPMWIQKAVLSNVLVLIKEKYIPNGMNLAKGKVIDKSETELKDFFLDENGNPKDNDDWVLVRVPASVPIPYESMIKVGTIDQTTYDMLLQADDEGFLSFWCETLNKHDKATQEKFMTIDSLKQYLPKSAPTGHPVIDSPFMIPQVVDEDDKELVEAAEAIANECTLLVRAQLEKMVGAKAPVDAIDSASGETTSSKAAKSTAKEISDDDYFNGRIMGLGLSYDSGTGKFSMPTLSKFISAIRDSPSKSMKREQAQSCIENIGNLLSKSMHYLARAADFPKLQTIVTSHFASGKFAIEVIESLETTTSGDGAIISMLLPDSNATAKAKADDKNQFLSEEAVGEHHSKRTAIPTSFTSINELTNINAVIALLGNILQLWLMYFDFDYNSLGSVPSMVHYALEIGNVLTSTEAKHWLKANPGDKQKLFYYVVSQTMSIMTAIARASRNVLVTTAIIKSEVDSIPTNDYALADRIFKESISRVQAIFLNSDTIPSTKLWMNSAAKKRLDDKDRKSLIASLAGSTPRGNGDERKRSLKGPEREGKRTKTDDFGKKGYVVCSENNFQLPKVLHNKGFKLCRSAIKDNHECPFKKNCAFEHVWFTELTEAQQKALVKHVDETDSLSFVNIEEKDLAKIRSSM